MHSRQLTSFNRVEWVDGGMGLLLKCLITLRLQPGANVTIHGLFPVRYGTQLSHNKIKNVWLTGKSTYLYELIKKFVNMYIKI
jgi:hypothetical protein